MALQTWILPILIGIIAAVLLIAILFNDKQRFADLGALIQLETSRPYYYGLNWVPLDYNASVPPGAMQGQISGAESPLWMNGVDGMVNYPVYNYYPKAPLNPTKSQDVKPAAVVSTNPNAVVNSSLDASQSLAFANPPQVFDPHKAYYWALSGGYPYPLPVMIMPPTDMDKVRGVEDKI
jgi:hypothetical protein